VAVASALPTGEQVFLVRADAEGFADAVSVSGLAAAVRAPILLTQPGRLPQATADAIAADTDVVIVGGTAAVSDDVAAQVRELAGSVRRVAGPDRYATSAAVASDPLGEGLGRDVAWVAAGGDFSDGLVAGPAAARDGARLLLVDGNDLDRSPTTRDVLRADPPLSIRMAGGRAALSTRVEQQLTMLLRAG
jgi:hypothetical protein